MGIIVYNSLSKKKEELKTLEENVVKMYSCGVTVYDKCHIGHARSLFVFDVIVRHLRNRGYRVKFVRNITDVDDKIINKARQLNKSFETVVNENIALYKKDIENLKVNFADYEPRATENIPEMIRHIEGLIKKEHAYPSGGDVYFKVRSFKDYGKLSGQSIDKMLEAVRIDPDTKKQDPLDFVLWKKSKEGEPAWDSPWGPGRPGWHIECSAMSLKYLDSETIDIHAGGRDLIFPHHENEVAQSEALTGQTFARYWVHHGLLKIDGQKMAKSSGNFITLDAVLDRYSHNVLKLFYLQSHYASEIDFSWEKMEEVKKSYERIALLMKRLDEKAGPRDDKGATPDIDGDFRKRKDDFLASLDDDFNTPKALSVLFDLVKVSNHLLDDVNQDDERKIKSARHVLTLMADSFAFDFEVDETLGPEEKSLLEERQQARAQKNYQRSDEIRDELKARGILVEDGRDGQTWRRVS
ncbi:MAG: cysteine--tRNA ligase [Candidatus Omnitrophica bacterium]|nr:cysteine--tRNA ligase [Candidatus Omnitrophota bacterium]